MARFEKGKSGNPLGRPKALATHAQLRELVGTDLEKLIGVVRERALAGDMRAAEMLMARTIGPLRASDPPVTLPLTGDPGQDARTIARAAGAGEIGPGTAQQLMGAIAGLARTLETTEILARLEALEAKDAIHSDAAA